MEQRGSFGIWMGGGLLVLAVVTANCTAKPRDFGAGGAGGSSANSGSSASSPSSSSSGGGKLCTPGANSGCGNAQYCRTDTNTCADCYDFTRFQFGQPQTLKYGMPPNAKNPSYPRIGDNNELLFTYNTTNGVPNNLDLAHAPQTQSSPPKWGVALAEAQPPNSVVDEAGPLFLKDGMGIKDAFNAGGNVEFDKPILLYHSNPANPLSFQVMAVNPGSGKGADVVVTVGGTRNYDIAVATQASPVRFWYMSDSNFANDQLVTALPGAAPASLPSIQLDNGCDAFGGLTPWVTPLGNWMLFSSSYLDDKNGCMPLANSPSHIFYISLKQNGFPSTPTALPVFKTDAAANRTTPSMSADLCALYFTETDSTGHSEMYSALRE